MSAIRVWQGKINAGEFASLTALVAGCASPLQNSVSQFITDCLRGSGAIRHVSETLKDDRVEAMDCGTHQQRDTSAALVPVQKEITVEELCFKYSPKAPRLSVDHLSASFPLGSYVVLCGGSGSGKSTVLNVIMQFRRATKGRLLFDGVDVLTT